jgi:hypothetical protein
MQNLAINCAAYPDHYTCQPGYVNPDWAKGIVSFQNLMVNCVEYPEHEYCQQLAVEEAPPSEILAQIDYALDLVKENMKFSDISRVKVIIDFLKTLNEQSRGAFVKYAGNSFTAALIKMNRIVEANRNLGQKAKSAGWSAAAAITDANDWIESLDDLEDNEDFIETWNALISGLNRARQSAIASAKEMNKLQGEAEAQVAPAIKDVKDMIRFT